MRVVLTKKMVVGHVMRYPGEVVEVQDHEGAKAANDTKHEDAKDEPTPAMDDLAQDAPTPRRKGRTQI